MPLTYTGPLGELSLLRRAGGVGRCRTLEDIVSGISPGKRIICVSSAVALAGLSDTITEEAVSGDSAGETPLGLTARPLIKRRLPSG